MKKRWMKSVIEGADANTFDLPWMRGARRNAWKAGARARAKAA